MTIGIVSRQIEEPRIIDMDEKRIFQDRNEDEDEEIIEKKKKKKMQLAKLMDTRTINTLPLHSPLNYTPHFNLEFDLAVQDHCRLQANQQALAACNIFNDQATDQKYIQCKKKASKNARNSIDIGRVDKATRNCKVVVIGDVAVGKTCLVNRFGHAVYTSTYQTTIGVDFDVQRFNILGQPYVLQIWDTAGLERFKCITSSYYRGCQVGLIVFDMTNMGTLANVLKWRNEILTCSKTFEQLAKEHETSRLNVDESKTPNDQQNEIPLLFLVGTKCDLPQADSHRQFVSQQANKVASMIGAELWFVSAQTGENVNELFTRIAALSFNRCILNEVRQLKFDASTVGACLKEKILQQQRELWSQSSKLIKITRKKDGDDRRTRCVNVQCVIK